MAAIRRMKLGTIVTIDHPAIVEIAWLAGFDWLWIDGEHGRFNEVSAATACAVAAGGHPYSCGCRIVPRRQSSGFSISAATELFCRRFHRRLKWMRLREPHFIRRVESAVWGLRGRRDMATRFAECLRTQDYAIVVQIENVAGVRNAEAIVGHSAVDAVVIGPYDLSGSFGMPGKIESSQVVEGIAEVLALLQKGRQAMWDFCRHSGEGEDLCERRV